MLLRCAVSRGVNARLRYDWRTPIACGWVTKIGSHAATASGASTVPCSGTSSARFRATPYSAGGTLRSGGPRATEFVHSRVPDRELNATNRAPRARQDRKSVVEGKSVSVRVDLGGCRIIKKK